MANFLHLALTKEAFINFLCVGGGGSGGKRQWWGLLKSSFYLLLSLELQTTCNAEQLSEVTHLYKEKSEGIGNSRSKTRVWETNMQQAN